MADGTTFDIDLSGIKGAAAVTAAADGVQQLADSLTQAQASVTAAADAVMAGEAAYKAAESAANKAALSVEKIGLAVNAQQGKVAAAAAEFGLFGPETQRASAKLAELVARQSEAAAKAASTAAAMNTEAASLDRLKAAAANASAAQVNVSKALDQAKAKADSLAKSQAAAIGSGKANEAAEAFGRLGGPLGALGQKAFASADALKKLSGSLGDAGPYAAAAVAVVGIATAVATVTAAALVGIAAVTLWAIELADVNGELKKIKESTSINLKKIFGSLNIKPLLGELAKIPALFAEGSASANAIKTVFQSLFQPIVDGITAFVPKMVSAFIQFEILVLKALIAIKPFGSKIQLVAEAFGILALVVAAMAVGFTAAVIAPFAIIIGLATAVITGILAFADTLINAGKAAIDFGASLFSGIQGPLQAALDWLGGLSLSSIGGQLIQGLIDGITGAGGGVLKALTGIATSAIDGVKGLLQINSPSKVFAAIGASTGEGMVDGIDGSAGDVQNSLEGIVTPPDAPAGGGGLGKGSGGPAVQIENLIIQSATDDPKSFAEAFRAELSSLVSQAGGAVPA